MIDAERMLGSLVRNALGGGRRRRRRRRSLFGLGRGALGLGALGVAIATFEHLTQTKSPAAPAPSGTAPLPPLPTPPAAAPTGGAEVLPPLPDTARQPAAAAAPTDALLLVRAMIAAANADHQVDEEERRRILRALDESGATSEERGFVLAELDAPIALGALVERASTPELARQVYLASRMAIDVDTAAEGNYLARLAERLGLDAAAVAELEGMLEGEPDPGDPGA